MEHNIGAETGTDNTSAALHALVDELDSLISTAWETIYDELDRRGPAPARMPSRLGNLLHRFDVLAFRLRQLAVHADPEGSR